MANGADSLKALNDRIYKYKKTDRLSDPDPDIGCIILAMPFYFEQEDWIPVPSNWGSSIVQGKTYDTESVTGRNLYQQITERLEWQRSINAGYLGEAIQSNRYGKEQIIKPRIGQGAFKVLITDTYQRRCAITGEKTLPVLEAAHIKSYSLNGPHAINNGLLLR